MSKKLSETIQPLTDAKKAQLQKLIDRAARASSAEFRAVTALNDLCVKIYGHAPSDIDCDSIIDAVLGGAGDTNGMSADEFDAEMKNSLEVFSR